jgi:tyrosyl-tRNA synthetase
MSKSNPSAGILIHDDEPMIKDKINKAYCPIGVSLNNPVLEIIRYIVFHDAAEFQIERNSKYGGDISYTDYFDLQLDYEKEKIHPIDLKIATCRYLDKIIDPIRKHFNGWDVVNKI